MIVIESRTWHSHRFDPAIFAITQDHSSFIRRTSARSLACDRFTSAGRSDERLFISERTRIGARFVGLKMITQNTCRFPVVCWESLFLFWELHMAFHVEEKRAAQEHQISIAFMFGVFNW